MNNPNQNKPAVVAPGAADKPQQPATAQPAQPAEKGAGPAHAKPIPEAAMPDLSVKPANSDCASDAKVTAPAPAPVAAIAEPKTV